MKCDDGLEYYSDLVYNYAHLILCKEEINMDLMHYQAKEPFTQKHLLTLQDWSEDEIYQSLSLALQLRKVDKSRLAFLERRWP